jgi:hypothetical protein
MKASRGMGAILPNKIPKDGKSAVLLKKGGMAKKRLKRFESGGSTSGVQGDTANPQLVAQLDPASMTQAQMDAYLASQGAADLYAGKKRGGVVKQLKRKMK